jgi:uncharacterized protein
MMKEQRVLVLPGYLNSSPGHWQTRWETAYPHFTRVQMPDWERVECDAWCRALDSAVAGAAAEGASVLLAAHSLGCLTVAHWTARHARAERLAQVAGALLVALPDPHGPAFPADAHGFYPVPLTALPFRSIVVASSDDPYGSVAFSERCAKAWGSRWIDIGARGHINAESGLGDWPQGQEWLASLAA